MKRTYSDIRNNTNFNVDVMKHFYGSLGYCYMFTGNYRFSDSENHPVTEESTDAAYTFGVICKDDPLYELTMYFENRTDGEIRFIGSITTEL